MNEREREGEGGNIEALKSDLEASTVQNDHSEEGGGE